MKLKFKKDYCVVETQVVLTAADKVQVAQLLTALDKCPQDDRECTYTIVPEDLMQDVKTLLKNLAGRTRSSVESSVFVLHKEAMTDEELAELAEAEERAKTKEDDDMQAPEPRAIPMC